MSLVRENHIDFGPTFAAEKLEEDHGLKVSRETLHKWMREAGIWLSRKQRRTFHQPRLRRECFGELIQIDGSNHHWFEDRGLSFTLLISINDATSTLMHLSAVLEHIKAEQDKTPPKKRRVGKQRSRYKPNGRGNDGWNSQADRKRIADRKAGQGCDI